MHQFSPIDAPRTTRPGRVRPVEVSAPEAPQDPSRGAAAGRGSDRVELSSVARFLNQLKSGDIERTDLINKVRAEIEAGTYDTDEKFDAVVDAIKEDLELELD
jgi:anti-sigma28 factor (negative regulator of flagellin synthesis)